MSILFGAFSISIYYHI